MTDDDAKTFSLQMIALSEIYKREVSQVLMTIYFEALREYPIDDVVRAVARHIKSPDQGQFFPKPADLIRLLEGDSHGKALQAWSMAKEAAVKHSPYMTVVFADAIVGVVVEEMGGWQDFYDWSDKEMPFKQQEFCLRYRQHLLRGDVLESPVLIGYFQSENTRTGFPTVDTPIMIGAVERKAIGPMP